jgi:hypothetical protein
MKRWALIGLLTCCSLLAGCDADRISKLEKENAELRSKVEKQNVALQYDLQAKCSKDASLFFNGNWSHEKDTTFLDFTNHYDSKLNKCFILSEYHFNSHLAGPDGTSWSNVTSLFDVYENSKYGEFEENHYTYFKPQIRNTDEVIMCEVTGTKCKTIDEFDNLIRPYMND